MNISRAPEFASRRAGAQSTCAHVAPQDRREIRVDHRGVAAADQLDQRRDLVADRDLGEAHLARERGDLLLVIRIAIGVHEHDRDRLDAVGERRIEFAAHRTEVRLQLDRAVGAHALVHLDDALEQHLGLDDVLGENLRAVLVADAQRVAETFRRHQQRAVALALEQRIGGDRGAHLHGADAALRDRLALLQAEQVADALHGGVLVGFRIFREQLVRGELAVRRAADDVREGAAAIDPEVPGAAHAALSVRHARACAGHPRLSALTKQVVDGRDKPGRSDARAEHRSG